MPGGHLKTFYMANLSTKESDTAQDPRGLHELPSFLVESLSFENSLDNFQILTILSFLRLTFKR